MDTTQQALFSAISYSYSRTVQSEFSLLRHPLRTSVQYLDTSLNHILKELETIFLELPQLVGAEQTFKEAYTENLLAHRKTLESNYRSLHALQRELQHITSLFNTTVGLEEASYDDFGMTALEAENLEFEHLAKDCAQFVFHETGKQTRQAHAHLLLPYVPMRMTKESFLAYIEKSIAHIACEPSSENYHFLFSILSQLLDGRLYPNYGAEHKDLYESVEALRTLQDPDIFFQEAELLNETLQGLLEVSAHLYQMICSLSNLLIFDGLTFETLTDMHVMFYDLYCSVKNVLLNDQDAEIILETLPERVDELCTSLQKNYEKHLEKAEENPLLTLIATQLFMEVTHVFGFDSTPTATALPAQKEAIHQFMNDLRTYFNEQPVLERKLRMQYFISIVPFLMSEPTFTQYILQGFKNVASPKKNLFTAMYLTNILEENGFFESSNLTTF